MSEWIELRTEDQLEQINVQSFQTPVVIFKHSTRCSISSTALNRFNRDWPSKGQDFPAYFLDLLQYRNLSNAISERYSVMHQSPQVLLISNGKCIYNASHFEIDVEEIVQNAAEKK